jgi:hypothetical protein
VTAMTTEAVPAASEEPGDHWKPTRSVEKILATAQALALDPPGVGRAAYLHGLLCQVAMPRSRVDGRRFERRSGNALIVLEAGGIIKHGRYVEVPLPYGTRPRLILSYISTTAVKENTRIIQIGDSMHQFMECIGFDRSGHEYSRVRAQMEALSACSMTLGFSNETLYAKPIERFQAWLSATDDQRSFWPAEIELSARFYETLREHAVPLAKDALAALRGSALALDVYAWLAHRLYRVLKRDGDRVSWANLRDQFGQEYRDPKNFKREFLHALRAACAVYPSATLKQVTGGLILLPSPPPIQKATVVVALPGHRDQGADK